MDRAGVAHHGVDQIGGLSRRRASGGRVEGGQSLGLFHVIGRGAAGRDGEGAGAIDEIARDPEREEPVRAVEPLAVVVDRAVRPGREQDPVEADIEEVRHLWAAQHGLTHHGIASVGGDQEVDVAEVPRLARGLVVVADREIARPGRAARHLRAVGHDGRYRPAQQRIELRPADADAGRIGDAVERQVHQDLARGQRHAPAAPGQARGADGSGLPGQEGVEAGHGVGTDIEARAGFRVIGRAGAFEADDLAIVPLPQTRCNETAGDPGPDDDDLGLGTAHVRSRRTAATTARRAAAPGWLQSRGAPRRSPRRRRIVRRSAARPPRARAAARSRAGRRH